MLFHIKGGLHSCGGQHLCSLFPEAYVVAHEESIFFMTLVEEVFVSAEALK